MQQIDESIARLTAEEMRERLKETDETFKPSPTETEARAHARRASRPQSERRKIPKGTFKRRQRV